MSELKGCNSHSCAVTPPKGVGTNGPCRCMVSDYRGQSLIRSLQAKVDELTVEKENIHTNLTNEALRLVDVCDERQAIITELEAERGNFNTFWACTMHSNHASLRCAICDENKLIELQARVDALEGLCAITGVIEREKKYIAAQAKVEELTTGIRAHIEWADPFNCNDLEILIGDMQEVSDAK